MKCWSVFVLMIAGLSCSAEMIWDKSTLTLVQKGGGYGRMVRLKPGIILCSYEYDKKAWVRTSTDNGRTWQSEVLVASCPHGSAANPEIIRLANDTVLCFFNERPRKGTGMPFTIMVSESKDSGKTWSAARRLYRADSEFQNGCWEPAAAQLPSGEIQLFFANEGPYRSTAEQEITLIRSLDNGSKWSEPETVAFRARHRDGMPVPLVLRDNKGVVVAIEDNGVNGRFKPVLLHTSLADNWRDIPINGGSSRRYSALKTPLPDDVYAGAPYLCQLPSGMTVLSVQSTADGRTQPQMVVYLGDNEAKSFGDKSIPFPSPPSVSALWNSLFVKGSNTVTAISTTRIGDVQGLWAVDGHVQNKSEGGRGVSQEEVEQAKPAVR